jgi:ankyrin repeat protein
MDEPDSDGETPFCLAIRLGHLNGLKMLLSMRPAAHKAGKIRGNPLTSAAEFGRDGILELLLENYHNLRNYSNDIRQALIVATKAGYHSTMKLILQHCATVEDAERSRSCALFYAAQKKDKKTTLLLLDAGAVTLKAEDLGFLDDTESKAVEEAHKYVQELRGSFPRMTGT